MEDGIPGHYTSRSVVLKDSPIHKIEDLKGKAVATPGVGSAVDIGLRIMLRRHGLEAGQDYTVIQVRPANMKPFLLQHKADLVTVSTPYAFDPALLKASRPLFTRREIGKVRANRFSGAPVPATSRSIARRSWI